MAIQRRSGEFRRSLADGQIGESLIARWLRSRGNLILPVYDVEIDTGKGPRIFPPLGLAHATLIAPDMLAKGKSFVAWVEAKHKHTASWFRKKQRWQTGIDERHYQHYKQVQELSGWPVWLLFLQRDDGPSNAEPWAPPRPTGLYACSLDQKPSDRGSYARDSAGRRYPMVYWGICELKKWATLADVEESADEDWDVPF